MTIDKLARKHFDAYKRVKNATIELKDLQIEKEKNSVTLARYGLHAIGYTVIGIAGINAHWLLPAIMGVGAFYSLMRVIYHYNDAIDKHNEIIEKEKEVQELKNDSDYVKAIYFEYGEESMMKKG
ncbi:hypothetical protein ACFL1H_03135 [Nanoarchaeota archaeon]